MTNDKKLRQRYTEVAYCSVYIKHTISLKKPQQTQKH